MEQKGKEDKSPQYNMVARKRSRDDNTDNDDEDDDDVEYTAQELSQMTRSERKRHREKKRRSDVNKGFDELMTLLLEIDPDVKKEAEEKAKRGQWKGNIGAQEDNLLSRVDLINRTVNVLRRVHNENETRKKIITELTQNISINRNPNESQWLNESSRGSSSEGYDAARSAIASQYGSTLEQRLPLSIYSRRPDLHTSQTGLLHPSLYLQNNVQGAGIGSQQIPPHLMSIHQAEIASRQHQLALLQQRIQEREEFARIYGIDLSGTFPFQQHDPSFNNQRQL